MRALSEAQQRKYRRLLRELRAEFPALAPVRVYFRELTDELGSTEAVFEGTRLHHFVIRLHAGLNWQTLWQVLIHEWAHALAWIEGVAVEHHGPEWGLALSRIYQELHEP